MAKKPNLGKLNLNPQLDSHVVYDEPTRENSYVQGPADIPYGTTDGFRYGFEQTGMRHKQSSLGKFVKKGS